MLASLNNLGMMVGALIIGIIVDKNSPDSFRMTVNFDTLHYVLLSLSASAFLVTVYLNFRVETNETILNAVVKDY